MVEYPEFSDIIGKMPGYLRELESCPIIPMDTRQERGNLGSKLPPANAGIYVLYEDDKPIYVGRSDRLKERLLEHGQPSNGRETATLAFRIAKVDFQEKHPDASFSSMGDLASRLDFVPLFGAAKSRVKKMGVRAVAIQDPIEQTIFEIYAHLALKTPYNSFENH